MDINVTRSDNFIVSKPMGRLDGTNSRDFEEALKGELENGECTVILDMEDLVYISSAGLRAVLLIAKTLKSKNFELRLCKLSKQILEVFEITGFDMVIPIFDDEAAAKAG
ncbi:MAG: STAS domain-containing protein [Rhodobacteraceae bacterium]|nr:STAS domain-containing protein [Paracoccaceae bacterium]